MWGCEREREREREREGKEAYAPSFEHPVEDCIDDFVCDNLSHEHGALMLKRCDRIHAELLLREAVQRAHFDIVLRRREAAHARYGKWRAA